MIPGKEAVLLMRTYSWKHFVSTAIPNVVAVIADPLPCVYEWRMCTMESPLQSWVEYTC